jgi:hypothetical protein
MKDATTQLLALILLAFAMSCGLLFTVNHDLSDRISALEKKAGIR